MCLYAQAVEGSFGASKQAEGTDSAWGLARAGREDRSYWACCERQLTVY
jgi:hypothetical protein